MILFLLLFYTFFIIGLVGFGGGYAMISMIQGEVVTRYHWLTSQQFTDIIAISQMTPGPIGINSATYVGYTAAVNAGYPHWVGILGSVMATVAVVLPSFILMYTITRLLIKYRGRGIRIVGNEDITVYVTAPAVHSFEVKGSSSISINSRLDVAGKDATLTVNDPGDISAKAVSCRSFKGVVNGSGDLDINSHVDASDDIDLTVNGSGNAEVDAISCKRGTVTLQGSGDISVDAVKASELAVTVNGSGDAECNEIAATTVKAELSGSGDIAVDGKSKNANLTANASGDISAEDLRADNVKALVNGSGEINCYAAKALDATINGSGEVRYGGSPRVTAHGRNNDNISRN